MAQFPRAKVMMFGSAAAYLAIKGSDIDVVVIDKSVTLNKLFFDTFERLSKISRFKDSVEKIICAVPIVKLKCRKTGLSCDITFNREDCYKGVATSLALQAQYPELRPLYFVLKVFLRERGSLDKTKKGGVCSFMLLNLIVSYLQTSYKEQYHASKMQSSSWAEPTMRDIPLHKHLLGFFRHYGYRIDARETGISIRCGGFFFGKTEDDVMQGRSGFSRLYVESPLNRMEDCAQGAYNYALIKKHFRLAHDLLFAYGPHSKSILTLIIHDELFPYFAQVDE